jgi:DNA modification methylase
VTNRFKLVHAEAFEWMSACKPESIHAAVTDPPYTVVEYHPEQLHKKRNGNGGVWRLPQSFDGWARKQVPRFTDLTGTQRTSIFEFNRKLAVHLERILVPGAHIILASQNVLSHLVLAAFSEVGFEVRGQVARLVNTFRGGDRPKGAHERYKEVSVIPRSCWEPWLIFRKRSELTVEKTLERWGTGGLRRPSQDVPFSDLVVCHPTRGPEQRIATHPTQKPQALMRGLVRAALPLRKGVILDPFMGCGSTVAAANAMGLRSIGVERDKDFYEMAKMAVPKLSALDVDSNAIWPEKERRNSPSKRRTPSTALPPST